MLNKRVAFAIATALAVGWASAAHAATVHPECVAPTSPVRGTLKVKSRTGGTVVLVAHVETVSPLKQAVRAVIRVPAGATVVSGETVFEIPAGDLVRDAEVTLSYAKVPSGDVVLDVEAKGDSFAYRAKDTYRFGRQQKTRAKPNASGPRLKMGNKDFGASIPLQ